MFLAEVTNKITELAPQQVGVLAVIVFSAFAVYWRLFQKIENQGPQTRPDLLALPEMLTGGMILGYFLLLITARLAGGGGSAPKELPSGVPIEQLIIKSTMTLALAAIAVMVMVMTRGGRLRNVFGFNKASPGKVIGWGIGLGFLALPLALGAREVFVQLVGSNEAPQALVQKFVAAIKEGNGNLMGLIAISAGIVAPFAEEILFRGTFYPMLTRSVGRGPAALATAILFAASHDTLSDAPGLMILALCLTLAYEVTGSLLVPMVMHAVFNGTSLLAMWWQVSHGMTP